MTWWNEAGALWGGWAGCLLAMMMLVAFWGAVIAALAALLGGGRHRSAARTLKSSATLRCPASPPPIASRRRTPPATTMNGQSVGTTILTRRTFLAATLAASTAAMAACGKPTSVNPATDPIGAAEAARPPHTGRTVTAALTPGPADIDLGGPVARTLAYNNIVPGPLIRANVGDELAISVTNGLNHPSSLHWHGIALRNDMDGGATPATPNIDPSSNFTYRFFCASSRYLLGASAHRPRRRLRTLRAGHHRRSGRTGRLRRRVDRGAR